MCAKNMVWLMRNAKWIVDGRRTDTHGVAKNETGDRPEAGRCAAIGSCLTCATIVTSNLILVGKQALDGWGESKPWRALEIHS
jgi:hypothetical protein